MAATGIFLAPTTPKIKSVKLLNFTSWIFRYFLGKIDSGGYVSIRLATLYRHLAFSAHTVHPRPKISRKNRKSPQIDQNPRLPPKFPGFCYVFCYFLLFSLQRAPIKPSTGSIAICGHLQLIEVQAIVKCGAKVQGPTQGALIPCWIAQPTGLHRRPSKR